MLPLCGRPPHELHHREPQDLKEERGVGGGMWGAQGCVGEKETAFGEMIPSSSLKDKKWAEGWLEVFLLIQTALVNFFGHRDFRYPSYYIFSSSVLCVGISL